LGELALVLPQRFRPAVVKPSSYGYPEDPYRFTFSLPNPRFASWVVWRMARFVAFCRILACLSPHFRRAPANGADRQAGTDSLPGDGKGIGTEGNHLRRAPRNAPYRGIGKLYHFFTFSLPNSRFVGGKVAEAGKLHQVGVVLLQLVERQWVISPKGCFRCRNGAEMVQFSGGANCREKGRPRKAKGRSHKARSHRATLMEADEAAV